MRLRLPALVGVALMLLLVPGAAYGADEPKPATPPTTTPAEPTTPEERAKAKPAETTTPPATPVVEPKKEEEPEDHTFYISISPIHLLAPIVELTGELKLHRKIGVALIGGYGTLKVETPGGPQSAVRFSVWEVGGQFVGYPVGHFDHGMQLGAEILYAGVTGNTSANGVTITGAANGLSAGPFIGYKFASKVGFSLNAQLGVGYAIARAEATASTGQTASGNKSDILPILNINLGWSF